MVRGLTASLAQEGFEPLVATVDGVEMKLAAAAFAGEPPWVSRRLVWLSPMRPSA
jgi:hypothetical protein